MRAPAKVHIHLSSSRPWLKGPASAAHVLIVAAALGAGAAVALGQGQQPTASANATVRVPHPILLPEANRPPDANDLMMMREQEQKDKEKDFKAANVERRKQIVDDSTRLVKLVEDLQAAVAKSDKDTLSLDVIRKADEIERLARSVKEKMKLSIGAY